MQGAPAGLVVAVAPLAPPGVQHGAPYIALLPSGHTLHCFLAAQLDHIARRRRRSPSLAGLTRRPHLPASSLLVLILKC